MDHALIDGKPDSNHSEEAQIIVDSTTPSDDPLENENLGELNDQWMLVNPHNQPQSPLVKINLFESLMKQHALNQVLPPQTTNEITKPEEAGNPIESLLDWSHEILSK